MTNTNLQLIAQLALINNNATRVRTTKRRTLEKERAMLQALVGHGLFHDKENKVAKEATKKVVKETPKRVEKKAPKIHLKRKTRIKRFALWANGKRVERWFTADDGWAPVIDLTGNDRNQGATVGKQAENLLEAAETAEQIRMD